VTSGGTTASCATKSSARHWCNLLHTEKTWCGYAEPPMLVFRVECRDTRQGQGGIACHSHFSISLS
jgi:hypothetical protein